MELNISGRNLTVPERFREYAEEKLAKLEALTDKVQRIDAKVSKKSHSKSADDDLTVELTVVGRGPVIRAEATSGDKFVAFDLALAKLAERLRRAKDRRKVHHGRHTPTPVYAATASLSGGEGAAPTDSESSAYEIENDIPAGDSPVLIRKKVFPAVKLSVDEAVDNMELVGHAFYFFVDSETDQHSVVYRRTGWTYGVITLDPNGAEGGSEKLHAYRSDDQDRVLA